ncbi:MFS transporter [uncultured Castellaniella sp.]|uniref:MFS transporter n=1 Tax=uncultured Castellaniella sp. TaxID=647907 RepID=UPI002607BF94|nr:MFS transporter [uncultured Castellaniella sp.]
MLVSYTLLVTAFFIGFFNRFAPATFAAPIGESLGLDAAALGGLAAAHFWVYTLMQVPAGVVIDRFGIRAPAMIGTLLTGVGALILSASGNYALALTGPCLVGLGMSLVFVAMMKNNAIWFDGRRFGMVTGVTLLIGTLGSLVSEAPARLLLELTDWRTVFQWLGLVTVAAALLILLFWRPPPMSDALRRRAMGMRRDSPHRGLWLDVIGSRQLWLILLAISGTNGTFYAFAGLWGTQLLSDGYGLSGASASWILTLALLPYGFGSLLFGQLSDGMRARKCFIWLSSLCNVAAWFWLLFAPGGGFTSGLVCFLALGLSSGAQVAVSFAAVKESVHAELAGSAIAFVNMGVFLVTAIVQTAYGWLLVLGADVSAAAYQTALWLPAGLSLVGFVAALRVRETYSFASA